MASRVSFLKLSLGLSSLNLISLRGATTSINHWTQRRTENYHSRKDTKWMELQAKEKTDEDQEAIGQY